MPELITHAITACLVLLCLDAIIQGVQTRSIGRPLFQLGAYFFVAVVLRLVTGYPQPRQAFGGGPTLALIVLMFFCILLGMAARYWFYLRGRFSTSAFLPPLLISPLVLLPLLGTVQPDVRPQAIQVISLAILAFQNGFFWRTVFEKAKP